MEENKNNLITETKKHEPKTHVLEPVKTQENKGEQNKHRRRRARKPYQVKAKAATATPPAERRERQIPRQRNKRHNAPARPSAKHKYRQTIAEKLVDTITNLVSKSFKIFIFWALFATALFGVGAYCIFDSATITRDFPLWYSILLGFVLFGVYCLFGLLYGILMAFLYTVKSFSDSMGNLVREAINRIKNSIESKIDNITDTVSRHEVTQVIKETFEELSKNIKQYAAKTAAGVIALTILSGAIYITRKVLLRTAKKIKNKADFYALLSARVSLVLAVILNLSLFSKIAIWFGYMAGAIVLSTQIILIFIVK